MKYALPMGPVPECEQIFAVFRNDDSRIYKEMLLRQLRAYTKVIPASLWIEIVEQEVEVEYDPKDEAASHLALWLYINRPIIWDKDAYKAICTLHRPSPTNLYANALTRISALSHAIPSKTPGLDKSIRMAAEMADEAHRILVGTQTQPSPAM